MALRDVLGRMGEKQRARKALLKQAQDTQQVEEILESRKKSANERELERFQDEDREELIQEALKVAREERQRDIDFNHNPLDVPNITKEGDFSVLKQRNIFAGRSNMFAGQGNIHQSNPHLLQSNMRLLR